jgi:hypothetical protein
VIGRHDTLGSILLIRFGIRNLWTKPKEAEVSVENTGFT